jgi:hypothetical protein
LSILDLAVAANCALNPKVFKEWNGRIERS